jgi:hypothetical protein
MIGFQVQVAVRVPALTLRLAQPVMTRPFARKATVPVHDVVAVSVMAPPLRGVADRESEIVEVPVAMVTEMDCVALAPTASVAVMVKFVLTRAADDDVLTTPVAVLIVMPLVEGAME